MRFGEGGGGLFLGKGSKTTTVRRKEKGKRKFQKKEN